MNRINKLLFIAVAAVIVILVALTATVVMTDHEHHDRPLFIGVLIALFVIIAILVVSYTMILKTRKAMAEQTARLHAIYNSIPALVFTKDLNNLYTSCNSTFEREFGVTKEDIIGQDYDAMYTTDKNTPAEFYASNQRVLKERETIVTENWYTYPGGVRKAMQIIRTPLVQNNTVIGLLGIATDITVRKTAEKAAEETHLRIKTMLDAIPIVCALIKEDLTVIDCNETAFKHSGCKTKQEFFDNYYKVFPEKQPDGENTLEKLKKYAKVAVQKGYNSFEAVYQTTLGVPHPVLVTLVRIDDYKDGFDNVLLSTVQDLTQLKSMTARIEAMIDNLPGMVFQHLYDPPEYTYTFVSKGSKELIGYAAEDLIGKSSVRYLNINNLEDAENVMIISEQTLAKGLPYETTYRITVPDGTEKVIWERSRVIETKTDGTPHLVEGYYCDITEQRLLESAQAASRAKSEFLAIMSHEIRTPMNSVLGFAELAIDRAIDYQVKDYLGKINDSAKWLLRIINDILDISKIEAGKMTFDNAPFELHEVVSRCQSVILPAAKEKGLDLRLYAEPIAGRKLIGDSVRLYQALMNLLSNAVKFTDMGSVKLSAVVKTIKTDEQGDTKAIVYFEVCDNGIGMNSKQIERIFEPFMQADSGTTRNYGGTGLGLSITANLVELMGGKLNVVSEPGAGSLFSFELDFDTIANAATESESHAPEKSKANKIQKPNFHQELVLICDDNFMNRELICEHLARVGLQSVETENGKEALEAVITRMENGEKPFDLIFMDMFMPVMDGMEAASRITQLGVGTPIVAMTANVMSGELEKYRKNNMPNCLGKPFTAQELWLILLKYLTPISMGDDDEAERLRQKAEILEKLRIAFAKNNRGTYDELVAAIDGKSFTLAHRLAHTLKGNAGQIAEPELQNAAMEVERLLKLHELPPIEKMSELKTAFDEVHKGLEPLLQSALTQQENIRPLSKSETAELFAELEPLLLNINPDSFNLVERLRAVPGADVLITRVENYEFKEAVDELNKLKGDYV
ncbi:MAG: ATP-binding protein [Oscillospiraceae bacterium]|nr:ATP-binding protein [Oscillospiraceae bacterium]